MPQFEVGWQTFRVGYDQFFKVFCESATVRGVVTHLKVQNQRVIFQVSGIWLNVIYQHHNKCFFAGVARSQEMRLINNNRSEGWTRQNSSWNGMKTFGGRPRWKPWRVCWCNTIEPHCCDTCWEICCVAPHIISHLLCRSAESASLSDWFADQAQTFREFINR